MASATALLSVSDIETAVHSAEQKIKSTLGDVKARARILRGFLDDCAAKQRIELRLRKKEK